MKFYRGYFQQLWITLRSDEVLGQLDTGYIEDFNGIEGQISLLTPVGNRIPVLMSEVLSDTPNIPHDSFTGAVELESFSNGLYIVQGRVRDLAGNYTIIGAVANPNFNEKVISLEFNLVPGFGLIVPMATLKLTGGFSFTSKIAAAHFIAPFPSEVNF